MYSELLLKWLRNVELCFTYVNETYEHMNCFTLDSKVFSLNN